MERVIRCNPYMNPYGNQDTNYYEINTQSEFRLIYHFVDPRFNPQMKIPFNKIDFELVYYIDGRQEQFIARKQGELSQNCVLYPKDSTAKVLFENHGLKSGILMCNVTVLVYDESMIDRQLTIVDTVETGIKLID